jgi:cysteine desulfurase family protein (TIGR01976 family)
MTTLTFHVSRGLGRLLAPGDEVVVTRLDHQANVAPWKAMAAERGAVVREVPFHGGSSTLDEEALDAALGPNTRLVAVGGASNALGTINDVAAIVARARAAGALTFVDGVHLTPHRLPDVGALGCDAFACSPYKFYGPHVGVLFMRRELQRGLEVPRLECAGASPPERLETGTLCHEGIVGAGAAVDFLAGLAHPDPREHDDRRSRLQATYEELHQRGDELLERLWDGLRDIRRVTLYGVPPGRPPTPTVAFTVKGRDAEAVARHLSTRLGVYVSHGDFYASAVVEDLGLAERGGLVRAGVACYTTHEEVDRLVRGVAELAHA